MSITDLESVRDITAPLDFVESTLKIAGVEMGKPLTSFVLVQNPSSCNSKAEDMCTSVNVVELVRYFNVCGHLSINPLDEGFTLYHGNDIIAAQADAQTRLNKLNSETTIKNN